MDNDSSNYSYYDSKIVLPRPRRLTSHRESDLSTGSNIQVEKRNAFNFTRQAQINHNNNLAGISNSALPASTSFPTRIVDRISNRMTHIPHPPTHEKRSNLKTHYLQNTSTINNNDYLVPVDANKSPQIINAYKSYIEGRYSNENSTINEKYLQEVEKREKGENNQRYENIDENFSGESDYEVSSLQDGESSDGDDYTLKSSSESLQEALYSLPIKDKNKKLNNIVMTNANISGTGNEATSLPDLRTISSLKLQRFTHVSKNDSEAESEPGAPLGYKFRPLPPIPSNLANDTLNTTSHYERLDLLETSNEKRKHKTLKEVAQIVTAIPRLKAAAVRSRRLDGELSEITKYLPDKKLTIFVGTWNMKGTKSLPATLDNFLIPPEMEYLQDIYVIGTQEGTPVRREWQLRLQETFGPSHILIHSSNFGVLQMSVFVRRELVWFCSEVEQATIATRVAHKIKTKGALAVSFSIFGTSFLFITSHFASNMTKVSERIKDYNSICDGINLPLNYSGKSRDVTKRFERVFWCGDFNFRVEKTRNEVDETMRRYEGQNQLPLIKELLKYDQLNDLIKRGEVFRGFSEPTIHFMPTYKFDDGTDTYDTSSKKRVPSWTDRVLYRGEGNSLAYNSCNDYKVSDHRPVYAIFETSIEAYKDQYQVCGPTFDKEIYVEANLRRLAPSGNQDSSHVCVIL